MNALPNVPNVQQAGACDAPLPAIRQLTQGMREERSREPAIRRSVQSKPTVAGLGVAIIAVFCFMSSVPALGAPSLDPLSSPVESGQASEVLTNRAYESSTPLVRDADLATKRSKDQPPENTDDLPDNFGFSDVDKPTDQYMKTEGNALPSAGHFMGDGGFIRKDGTYAWSGGSDNFAGATGMGVGDILYQQAPEDVTAQLADSSNGPMITKLRQGMNGLPITNSQFAMIAGAAPQMAMDRLLDPKGWKASAKQMQQTQQAQGSDSQALSAERNGDSALEAMTQTLVNVANEGAATYTAATNPHKSYSQAIWMIQQMYKQCYLPMAILLLLPGAILTQVKGYVSYGILGSHDEDSSSPFAGIIRAIMAIFLIPATQLIVSYAVDIGNSLTLAVQQRIDVPAITAWAHEQTYNTLPANNQNFIDNAQPDSGAEDPTRGKLGDGSEQNVKFERQSYMTTTLQGIMNTISNLLSQGLATLNCFQVVLIAYLFLLGPVAAALFAWPSYSGASGNSLLFKKTFSSWLDGVVVLVLWKFWWCIVLLCMTVRLQQNAVNPTDEFEVFIYVAFMAILMFVPFQPFDFKPGEMVSLVLEKASHAGGGKGGGGGSAGGASSSRSGGASAGGGSSDESASDGGSGAGGDGASTATDGSSDDGSTGQRSAQVSMSTLNSGSMGSQYRQAAPANAVGSSGQAPSAPPPASPPPAGSARANAKAQPTNIAPPPMSAGKNEF